MLRMNGAPGRSNTISFGAVSYLRCRFVALIFCWSLEFGQPPSWERTVRTVPSLQLVLLISVAKHDLGQMRSRLRSTFGLHCPSLAAETATTNLSNFAFI